MNLRDWLIIIGIVIIIGILIDGYRRMRLAKKDALKMSLDMGGNFDNTPLDDFNPELPSGGARVISPDAMETGVVRMTPPEKTDFQPQVTKKETTTPKVNSVSAQEKNEKPGAQITVETINAPPTKNTKKSVAQLETNKNQPALVIVINVHALTHQGFPGSEVKRLLEACGLDHGHMSIFHRHEEDDLLSPIQFSVANAIEPGYFDPETLDEISTPGVSFFMTLPGPKDYMKAFDYMLETAQCFARNLKGELKDENLSVMKPQTIEHCRQRIKEFKRQELSKTKLSTK